MKRFLMLMVVALLAGCSEPAPETSPSFKPVVDVQETMMWILDPAADVVWGSAGWVVTEAGEQDLSPTTDEGWAAARNNAALVAETGNLLMMAPRAKDQGPWMAYSTALVDAGVAAMNAAEAHDADALFEAGGNLYNVCTACHRQYIAYEK